MDRRQEKTRAAIFSAFTELLETNRYEKITVQQIIDRANIGRSTFYAHFETRDELLNAVCEELFGHIISTARDRSGTCGLYSDDSAPHSVFCHLLQHLEENDNNILTLLSCESSEIFMRYFRDNLATLIRDSFLDSETETRTDLPLDFLLNHITGSFVEMVLWWLKDRTRYTPQELDVFFRKVIEPVI